MLWASSYHPPPLTTSPSGIGGRHERARGAGGDQDGKGLRTRARAK